MKKLLSLAGVILSVLYLINPSGGFIEFIPDNIPGIGNLDEAAITGILIACLRNLGLDVLSIFGKKGDSKSTEVVDVD